jgi:Domain of unknown function (DUF4169)
MADIVNLRWARKHKQRAAAGAAAAENRARFGQSKTARSLAKAKAMQADRVHAGHRRAPPADGDDRGP